MMPIIEPDKSPLAGSITNLRVYLLFSLDFIVTHKGSGILKCYKRGLIVLVFSAVYQSISHNARRGGCRKKSRNLKRSVALCHNLLRKSYPSRRAVALRALKRLTTSMTSKPSLLLVPHAPFL